MKTTPRLARALFSKKPKVESIGIPIDLDSAIVALIKVIGENGVKSARMKSEAAYTIASHDELGRWIRNNWQLWLQGTPLREWFTLRGIHHPDDMSNIVLTSLHRYLKEKPFEIENQILEARSYWIKKGADPDTLQKKEPSA